MKIFFFVLLFSIPLLSQDIKNTDVFTESDLKYISYHTEYALNKFPSLLYNSYLIKEYYGKEEFKSALKLYNLTRTVITSRKGKYIDSVISIIQHTAIGRLKKNAMISLLDEYKEEFDKDIPINLIEMENLKVKLNYDYNHQRYYEYSYITKNFGNPYDNSINYEDLLLKGLNKHSQDLENKVSALSLYSKNETLEMIRNVLDKWYLIEMLPYEDRPNIYSLLLKSFDKDFQIKNEFSLSLSGGYFFNYDNNVSLQMPYYKSNIVTEWDLSIIPLYNLSVGYKLPLGDEKNSFSWIEVSAGYSMYTVSAKEKKVDKTRTEMGVGYNAQFGGYTLYVSYIENNIAENNNSFHILINTPMLYFADKLFITGGAEIMYMNVEGSFGLTRKEERIYSRRTEAEEIESLKFSEEFKGLKVSPLLGINYEFYRNATLFLSSDLYSAKLGISYYL